MYLAVAKECADALNFSSLSHWEKKFLQREQNVLSLLHLEYMSIPKI